MRQAPTDAGSHHGRPARGQGPARARRSSPAPVAALPIRTGIPDSGRPALSARARDRRPRAIEVDADAPSVAEITVRTVAVALAGRGVAEPGAVATRPAEAAPGPTVGVACASGRTAALAGAAALAVEHPGLNPGVANVLDAQSAGRAVAVALARRHAGSPVAANATVRAVEEARAGRARRDLGEAYLAVADEAGAAIRVRRA